ncbi:hypothetical protein Neosp_001628 [[Neocosmospora] mangrovei]
MECSGIDSESLMLAIQLQHQDLDEFERSKKGKHRADEMMDSDVALEACRQELKEVATVASDHALCLSIADLDAPLIAQIMAQEEQAARDREFALRLSTNPNATPAAARPIIKKREQITLDPTSIQMSKMLSRFVLVGARLSSATSVAIAGKRASAPIGMSTVFSEEQM